MDNKPQTPKEKSQRIRNKHKKAANALGFETMTKLANFVLALTPLQFTELLALIDKLADEGS